jgi:hypothetical protein
MILRRVVPSSKPLQITGFAPTVEIKPLIAVSESGLVGKFTVTITMSLTGMQCEWAPRVPKPGELKRRDLRVWREVRNRACESFARKTRLNVMVIEV